MTIPVTTGWLQFLLFILFVVGIGMLISSLMGLRGRRVHYKDDYGEHYYRRGKPHIHAGRGLGGVVLLVIALSLIWLSTLVQTYVNLGSDITVARVRATSIENLPHIMSVELSLYDKDGKETLHKTYAVLGDRWMLQGNIVKFPSWLNVLGIHSGYKLTRLEGQYDDPHDEETMKHKVIVLNGGDDDFFKTVYKQAWSSPFVDAAYGNAVILPADGQTYNVLVTQSGLYAKPATKG